jgi:hypothetical protein
VVAFSKLRGPSVLLGILVVAGLLAGCETGASTTANPITVDGGALVIQPAKTQPVIYGKQAAIFNLEHSEQLGSGWKLGEVDFGYVTVKHTVAGGAVATPKPRLAWVVFYQPGIFLTAGGAITGPVTCPGGQTPRASVAGRNALIVDAMDETSFLYTGAGTDNCGLAVKPVVRYASQLISVPWVDLGGDQVRATFPGCSVSGVGEPMGASNTAKGREVTLSILAYRRIAPCALPATSKVMDLGLTPELKRAFPRPWTHQPLGPLANGGQPS